MTGSDRGRVFDSGPLLLGVRHHGPGSARAVRAALEAARPRVVLIEGPPEADTLVALAADREMRPPVALLAHAVDEPGRSAFWPLAAFSPEWVAIRWALEAGVPARFIDLPAAHTLAWQYEEDVLAPSAPGTGTAAPAGPAEAGTGRRAGEEDGARSVRSGRRERGGGTGAETDPAAGVPRGAAGRAVAAHGTFVSRADVRVDPIAVLAEAAGHDDPERWWEDVVEHRRSPAEDGGTGTDGDQGNDAARDKGNRAGGGEDADGGQGRSEGVEFAPFLALEEAMTTLRETYGAGGHDRDLVREAHMRLRLRDARREFGEEVAVVCGAWHVPALRERTTVTADRARLKGLPKVKADMTWVPWTHRRLSRSSGYGAGIDSPGWYSHLFAAPDRPVERWLTRAAGLLRAEDRVVSSAHVIEAVRLASALAALRGRPLPGLSETNDAVRAVMCEGSDLPMALVHDRLVVGDAMGQVPASAPAVPLQRDLDRLQRRLRLKPEALQRELELDLRKENDAARSRLLHRLRLLGIRWGEPVASRGSTGTFRETWRLRWEPELSVQVAEAGVWGTTVLSAATAKAGTDATTAGSLADITALAEHCLLAGLGEALPVVMQVLADRAALDADVGHLAQALPALVRSLRYGDVRGTDTGALAEVAAGLAERVFVGLPPACVSLDRDAAEEMRGHVDAVHGAVALLGETPVTVAGDLRVRWRSVLRVLAGRDTAAGVVRGRAVRLLLDEGEVEQQEAARLMGLVLSPGTPPLDAAAWIDGFLGGGGGLLLVHDERLLGLLDGWLTGVPAQAFTDVLPLLRRTFSAYEPGVRRILGELVRRGPEDRAGATGIRTTGTPGFGAGQDDGRADAVIPLLRLLLDLDDVAPVGPRAEPAAPFGSAAPAGPAAPSGPPGSTASAGAAGPVGLTDSAALTAADEVPPPVVAAAGPVGEAGKGRALDPGDRARERLRRWRLVLGGETADGTGHALAGRDAAMDGALTALYGKGDKSPQGRDRSAGLGASAPSVARWLGDIRAYFPSPVVQVMQRDAIDRLGLSALLLEPEMLAAVEADVHLVGTLLSLNQVMPETTRETARAVVRKVVEDLEKRLATRTRATLAGALDRSARTVRPRHHDIDWNRTIAANLKNYLPEYGTVVPERLIGYGRAARSVKKEIILCIDQSGSMAASVVHASVFGAVLASMRSISTRLVVFDTAVVDLTEQLDDPVDVLFGVQLGGGTDINRALAYCQSRITRPTETVVVLISDLYEGGVRDGMLKRVAAMKSSGVQFVALLALSDEGAPAYDRDHAAALAALGAPAFACTPDLFPEVMAAAVEKRALPIPDGT